MRLRHETLPEGQKAHAPFRSAVGLAALSAALLLPMGAINPAFANRAPSHASNYSSSTPVRSPYMLEYGPLYEPDTRFYHAAKSIPDELRWVRETKVKYANALFLAQYPHYSLLEQDYDIIKQLNASLPKEKRLSALEWVTYQSGYIHLTQPAGAGTTLWARKHNVSSAIHRTERKYPSGVRLANESAAASQTQNNVQWKTFVQLWKTKVGYADAVFQTQFNAGVPSFMSLNLMEQDYGVIKQLNDSLPAEKRISVSEWEFIQRCYPDYKRRILESDAVPRHVNSHASASVKKPAGSLAHHNGKSPSSLGVFLNDLSTAQFAILVVILVIAGRFFVQNVLFGGLRRLGAGRPLDKRMDD